LCTFPGKRPLPRTKVSRLRWVAHILVVDDDTQVRLLAKNTLERFGYHVDCVSSGEAALDYVKDTRVDLVLLDMLMDPGINGRKTYEAMIKIHPGQRAVVASGFIEIYFYFRVHMQKISDL